MKKPRPNLAAIAAKLGLSISTVSRALRGHAAIRPETRAQVAAMAAEVGYRTPAERRDPRPTRQRILVLSLTEAQMYDSTLLSGISAGALEADVSILVHHARLDGCEQLLEARHQPVALREGEIDGIVLLHRWPRSVAAFLAQQLPVVSIVHEYPGLPIDHVGINDRYSLSVLVEHLRQGQHRAIGFFGFCPEVTWGRSRFAAYVEAMLAAGLPLHLPDTVPVTLEEALSPVIFPEAEWSRQIDRRIEAGVTGWIAASAATGESLLVHLRRRGIAVPDQVELVDCHGRPSPDPSFIPPITTTDVAGDDLGAAALRRLLTRIENPRESYRLILLPMDLVQGATTRPR